MLACVQPSLRGLPARSSSVPAVLHWAGRIRVGLARIAVISAAARSTAEFGEVLAALGRQLCAAFLSAPFPVALTPCARLQRIFPAMPVTDRRRPDLTRTDRADQLRVRPGRAWRLPAKQTCRPSRSLGLSPRAVSATARTEAAAARPKRGCPKSAARAAVQCRLTRPTQPAGRVGLSAAAALRVSAGSPRPAAVTRAPSRLGRSAFPGRAAQATACRH